MKRLLMFAITMFLGAGLTLAQNTGGDKKLNPQPLPPGIKAPEATSTPTKTTEKSSKKGHKGGKKDKKGSTPTTPPPK
jgi:hypothetical protein